MLDLNYSLTGQSSTSVRHHFLTQGIKNPLVGLRPKIDSGVGTNHAKGRGRGKE